MMIRLILTVDGEESEQLVGLLAKAMSRGEQGISDMRLERFDEGPRLKSKPRPDASAMVIPPHDPEAAAAADDLRQIKKKLFGAEANKAASAKKTRVKGAPPAAAVIYARLQKGPATYFELRAEMMRYGFASSSINAGMARARAAYREIQTRRLPGQLRQWFLAETPSAEPS